MLFSSDMAQHCDQLISHFESVFLKQKISSILEYFTTACPWIPDEDVANNEKFLMLVIESSHISSALPSLQRDVKR